MLDIRTRISLAFVKFVFNFSVDIVDSLKNGENQENKPTKIFYV